LRQWNGLPASDQWRFKDDPTYLTNYRPIALANTIYKLYTSTLTTLITSYEEDARLTTNDIYLTYVDFRNAFGSIDHAKLLAIMEDLGYPLPSKIHHKVGFVHLHPRVLT
jgi:hypothetical protein